MMAASSEIEAAVATATPPDQASTRPEDDSLLMAIDPNRPRRLVGVSTKMYFSLAQTRAYVNDFLTQLSLKHPTLLYKVDVFIIPDFLSVPSVVESLRNTRVMTGAQDCHFEDKGAYTGEVSAAQIAEAGCKIIELGHAERRRYFGETDVEAAKKAAAAARNHTIPLVCIGERNKGTVDEAVAECAVQVKAVINAVPDNAEIILAYEPVWAIGAPAPASADHVVAVTKELKTMCASRSGTTRILYGGSAGPGLYENLKEGVDGLFLGRFAHDPKQFIKTIEEIAAA